MDMMTFMYPSLIYIMLVKRAPNIGKYGFIRNSIQYSSYKS